MATANEKLNEKLTELSGKFERMSEKMDGHGKQLNRVYEALYGNGKPGLISEFRSLRENVQQHHESVKEIKNRSHSDWKWVITTLIAIAAVAVSLMK